MNSLSHFSNILNTLSALIFKCCTFLDPLLLANSLSENLSNKLMAPDLLDSMVSATSLLQSISNTLEPLTKSFKASTNNYPKNAMQPYAPFIIDEPPLVLQNHYHQLSFDDIIKNSEVPINPIKRRVPLDYAEPCPRCGAPNDYIYSHTKSQFRCKTCTSTFTIKPTYHDEITHHCPHCESKLSVHHNRSDYDVLVCQNSKCSFYLKNKKSLTDGETDHLLTNSGWHKLRYHFRLFDFNLAQISDFSDKTITSKVDLSKIHHSQYAVGLILTYYVNYGLSSRKTSQILSEIHGINISHQTVVNYAEAVASITETLNVKHPYELSDIITFDETYIKVNGKNNYVFFGSDTDKKIITSYRIFANRGTKEAVTTLSETFHKYSVLPKDLKVIADGNPIYNAAQVFFKMHDINFDLHQVIGISNKDEVSLAYRKYKQAEERLNRTYKQNYYGTNGYGSLRNANVYISLYVSYFNFLRKHSALRYKTPVTIDSVFNEHFMPNKWNILIQHVLDQYGSKKLVFH